MKIILITITSGFLVLFGLGFYVATHLPEDSGVVVGAEGAFARGTATSTRLEPNVAVTVFATTTQGIWRSITAVSSTIHCSVGETAVRQTGVTINSSSSKSFCYRAEEGDCDIPTLGTISCISEATATATTIISR